jgi:hypothetical protein
MRAITAIAVLVLSVCLAQQANGWLYGGWGYGLGLGMGYGYGMGYGLGLGWGWPYYRYFRSTMSEGDITNRIQCRYVREKGVISCTGSTGVVECAAVSNFTGLGDERHYELFGLGCDAGVGKDVAKDMYHYNLYPRSMDNKIWYNSTIKHDDVDVSLALFHSLSYKYYGYRVVDQGCFERFISLFKVANSDEVIEVNGVTPSITVRLFGEILDVVKPEKPEKSV